MRGGEDGLEEPGVGGGEDWEGLVPGIEVMGERVGTFGGDVGPADGLAGVLAR